MEKSRVEISTDYSLSIYHISGSFVHIISLSLQKNYARHMCPHFVGEIQVKLQKATEELVSRAGAGLCSLHSSVLQPPGCQVPGAPPSAGMKEGISLPLFLVLVHWLFWGGHGVPTGPAALVFNFKCHSPIEYLHIAAN